jgi:2-polyprenyl-6-methoxyphenol hydroxylase-like FAD-dependent oxidoreductase
MIGWKGNKISEMNFHDYEEDCGTPFWDFHRANLHMGLLERAIELGAVLRTKTKVMDIQYETSRDGSSTIGVAVCEDGQRFKADLIVGADGINSKCREILLGHEDPPLLTGDLAYRLLLNTEDMMKDPELRGFVEDPQVNYWIGPDAHAGKSKLIPENASINAEQSTTFFAAASSSTWSFLYRTICLQELTPCLVTSRRCAPCTKIGIHGYRSY